MNGTLSFRLHLVDDETGEVLAERSTVVRWLDGVPFVVRGQPFDHVADRERRVRTLAVGLPRHARR